MIICIADVVLKPGAQAQFKEAASACIAATREEPGNISYRLMADHGDDTRYTFVEEWKDQAAFDAHGQAAHFGTFVGAIGDLLAEPLGIALYTAEKK